MCLSLVAGCVHGGLSGATIESHVAAWGCFLRFLLFLCPCTSCLYPYHGVFFHGWSFGDRNATFLLDCTLSGIRFRWGVGSICATAVVLVYLRLLTILSFQDFYFQLYA